MFAHLRSSMGALSLVVALYLCAPGSAAPLTNQFVPVGVINTAASVGTDAFGVAYDPVNDRIWHHDGSGVLRAFTPFKNLNIGTLPIDGVTGLPSLNVSTGQMTPAPGGGLQALGFNQATGQLVMHSVGIGPLQGFDPFTGANVSPYATPIPAGTSFMDGLDIEGPGADVYFSPELAITRDSFKNGALFLDNTNPAQTDISAVSAGLALTRWAGIEAVTSLGTVYAVAEVDFGGGPVARTIATYGLLGNFIAVDPDGSPFASRIEDLAYDGRYLYGASLEDQRIFVFDIVGPGGTLAEPVPEPASLCLLGMAVAGAAGCACRRRRKGA